MDKQTAIDLLDNLLGMVEDNHESDYDAAIKMGIDALKSNAPNALSALDCVERQAAVDAIRAKDDYSNVAVAIGLGKAITAICELPSVQPQRWIPVTERLPEDRRESYWVCTDTEVQCECRWTNNIFGMGKTDKWGWSIFDYPQYSKVTAWMPLPEPYEPQESEVKK